MGKQSGYIFNIQKFSLHDGPGIRTTVFFKGCNLRCAWCANPESQKMQPQMTLDRTKCVGCGACVSHCAKAARSIRNGVSAVDEKRCSGCLECMELCPASAIGSEGREMTLEQVLSETLKDLAFYRQSGGGVTFSGGEVLLQQDFATALARELHANGVHVAIETAAAVSPDRFRVFLQEVDYVFVDLKHYDSVRHRSATGLGNEQILQNIGILCHSGVESMVRIPVIPGFNAAPEDALGFAQCLKAKGVQKVQLLPFHQMGERKYSLLERDYAYAGVAQLHPEDLEEYRQIMCAQGLDVRF